MGSIKGYLTLSFLWVIISPSCAEDSDSAAQEAQVLLDTYWRELSGDLIQSVSMTFTEKYRGPSEGCWIHRRAEVVDDGHRLRLSDVCIVNDPGPCPENLSQYCVYDYTFYDGGDRVIAYNLYPGMDGYPGRPAEALLPTPESELPFPDKVRFSFLPPGRTRGGRTRGWYESPQKFFVAFLGYRPAELEGGLYVREATEERWADGRRVLRALVARTPESTGTEFVFDPALPGTMLQRKHFARDGRLMARFEWAGWESAGGLLYPRTAKRYYTPRDHPENLVRDIVVYSMQINPSSLGDDLFTVEIPEDATIQDERVSPPLVNGKPFVVPPGTKFMVPDPASGGTKELPVEEVWPEMVAPK